MVRRVTEELTKVRCFGCLTLWIYCIVRVVSFLLFLILPLHFTYHCIYLFIHSWCQHPNGN
jgi:hypothetical protein